MVDVLISPDVKDCQWSEFDKFDYFLMKAFNLVKIQL